MPRQLLSPFRTYKEKRTVSELSLHIWGKNLSHSPNRAQYNGWSTVSERSKVPVDRSLFNLSGHFYRPHIIKIYDDNIDDNDDNVAYSPLHNVIVNVLNV